MTIDPLQRAYASLISGLHELAHHSDNALMQDGLIQRFEYTYDLAWKTLKRYLESEHQEDRADEWSRRDLYRIAAEAGLIDDPKAWFDFMKLRNLSSHTYNRETAARVAAAIPGFAADNVALIVVLRERLGDDPTG